MLTFLYCHSNLYDLLKSCKLAWWKCWQVFVKRIFCIEVLDERLFFCVSVSALYFKVMQLHVKILPWQQKLKWLSLQASRQERKRKCFILKLSTLHRTLEHERKCWGEGGFKKKIIPELGFLFLKKLFPVNSKMSLNSVVWLVSGKDVNFSYLGFKTVYCTSKLESAFSTTHSCCLNLLPSDDNRNNGCWKFCPLLIPKSQILVLCEAIDTVSNSGHPIKNVSFLCPMVDIILFCGVFFCFAGFFSCMIFSKLKNIIIFPDLFLTFHKNVQGKNNISIFQCNNVKQIFWF